MRELIFCGLLSGFVGAFIGVSFMALMSAASSADDEMMGDEQYK